MSHEVTIRESGEAEAYYVEKPAWHGLGTVVEKAKTSSEAIRLAGLDWNVVQIPVFGHLDEKLEVAGEVQRKRKQIRCDSQVANIRADNHLYLGTVGSVYKVVQNIEAFQFLDELIGGQEILFESAGSLKGGTQIWVLARLPEEYTVGEDDLHYPYIMLMNGHDGCHSVKMKPTQVRVVCWNTLSIALKTGQIAYSMRHTGDIKAKLKEARSIINLSYAGARARIQVFEGLAKKSIKKTQLEEFIDSVFPFKLDEEGKPKETTKLSNHRQVVRDNFEKEDATAAVRGTAFGLLNAFTHYIDHDRSTKGKTVELKTRSRFESSVVGMGDRYKTAALVSLQKQFKVEDVIV